jgi:putative ABC transport system substrate-binding protein
MRRREFLGALGGAAAWPLAADAQQPTMPTIGLLHSGSRAAFPEFMAAFHQGLNEAGYAEGRNVTIDYRWAEGQYDRLPALATDLVRRNVAVIVAGGGNVTALAARTATWTIPIVFTGSDDPVKLGLVQSYSRPAGNATGIGLINAVLTAKRLELLRELTPNAMTIGILVNPKNPNTAGQLADAQEATRSTGRRIQVLNGGNDREMEAAFIALAQQGPSALFVGADPLLSNLRDQIIALASRHSMPAIYNQRHFATAGGLVSYGPHFEEGYRQAGSYVARILKGEKPGDLPVVQPSKFQLVINTRTAKALGLTVPDKLLALADEVID